MDENDHLNLEDEASLIPFVIFECFTLGPKTCADSATRLATLKFSSQTIKNLFIVKREASVSVCYYDLLFAVLLTDP